MCMMVVGAAVGKGGGGEGEGGRERDTHTYTQTHTGKVSITLWEGVMISLFGSTGVNQQYPSTHITCTYASWYTLFNV